MAAAGDGSAPAIGELIGEASGARPRVPKRGDQTTGLVTDPAGNSEMRARNQEAAAAAAAVNSGAADGSGPVNDPDGLLGGGTSGGGGSWSDPSSLSR